MLPFYNIRPHHKQSSKSVLTSCCASTKSGLSLSYDEKDWASCVSRPNCSHVFIWKSRSQHHATSWRSCKAARARNATYNRSKLLKCITSSWLAWWFLSSVPAHLIPILTAVLHELHPHFREQGKADSWLASFDWPACELPWLMRLIWPLPPHTMISYTHNKPVKLPCGGSTLSRMNWAQIGNLHITQTRSRDGQVYSANCTAERYLN